MELVLSIGGFDSTAGAGVTRDLLTFRKLGVYGFAVVTAITFQNLSGFYGYRPLQPEDVSRQIESLLENCDIKYVKLSMVGSREVAKLLEREIEEHGWYVVFDPLLAAKNGYPLNRLEDIEPLLFLADVLVPNVPEAERISGMKIRNGADAVDAGKLIRERYGGYVIVKGGHLEGADYLIGDDVIVARMEHLEKVVHGTGCAYSSALTSYLARGLPLKDAFFSARKFIQEEIEKSVNLGGSYEVLP